MGIEKLKKFNELIVIWDEGGMRETEINDSEKTTGKNQSRMIYVCTIHMYISR